MVHENIKSAFNLSSLLTFLRRDSTQPTHALCSSSLLAIMSTAR